MNTRGKGEVELESSAKQSNSIMMTGIWWLHRNPLHRNTTNYSATQPELAIELAQRATRNHVAERTLPTDCGSATFNSANIAHILCAVDGRFLSWTVHLRWWTESAGGLRRQQFGRSAHSTKPRVESYRPVPQSNHERKLYVDFLHAVAAAQPDAEQNRQPGLE